MDTAAVTDVTVMDMATVTTIDTAMGTATEILTDMAAVLTKRVFSPEEKNIPTVRLPKPKRILKCTGLLYFSI